MLLQETARKLASPEQIVRRQTWTGGVAADVARLGFSQILGAQDVIYDLSLRS